MSTDFLPISKAAKYLNVSPDTLRRWQREGKISATRTPGGIRLFSLTELNKIRFPSVLQAKEVAEYLQISPSTVRRLADAGVLPSHKDHKGNRTFILADIQSFQNKADIQSSIPSHNQIFDFPIVSEITTEVREIQTPNKYVNESTIGLNPLAETNLEEFPKQKLRLSTMSIVRNLRSSVLTTGLIALILIFSAYIFLFNKPTTTKPTTQSSVVRSQITTTAAVLGENTDANIIKQATNTLTHLIRSAQNMFYKLMGASTPNLSETYTIDNAKVQGSTGLRGTIGSKGTTGATGTSGATGPKGDKGDQGNKGDTGEGEDGEAGATGAIGATGAAGTGTSDSLFTNTDNLLFPGISSDRSLALGNTSNDFSTTSTSSARVYLDGTTGNASLSGSLTLGNQQTIRSAYGPVQLQYKSAPDTYTTGLFLQDTTGNVGIGTTNPSYNLDLSTSNLVGTGHTVARIRSENNAAYLTLDGSSAFSAPTSISMSVNGSNRANIEYLNSLSALSLYSLYQGNGLNIQYQTNNIGIGTTSPSTRLDVQGGYGGNSAVTFNQTNLSGDIFTASSSGTTRFTINNSGTVGVGVASASAQLDVQSTNQHLPGSGLAKYYWNPGATSTFTGDLFSMDVGSYGSIIGNLFNIKNNGSSLFSVSQSKITSNLPHEFTSPGDISIAYDLNFTNPTASRITSEASIYIEAGPIYANNHVVLKAYNEGKIYVDARSLNVGGNGSTRGLLTVDNTGKSAIGYSLMSLNQTENQDIFTASSSGTPRFTIANSGNVGVGTATPSALVDIQGGYGGNAALRVNQTKAGDIFTASASGTPMFTIKNDGSVGIGTTTPTSNLHLYNSANGSIAADTGSGNVSDFRLLEAGTAKWYLLNRGSDLDKFQIAGEGGFGTNLYLTLDQSGLFGLGTSSPASRLDVQGGYKGNAAATINQTNNGDILTASSSGQTRFTLTQNGKATFQQQNANVGAVVIEPSTQNAYVNLIKDGISNYSGVRFQYGSIGAETTNWTFGYTGGITGDELGFKANDNTYKLVLNQNGTVGIGTTSPTSRLDVQGGYAGNSAVTINQTNSGDIFTASSSGTPRFTIANNGRVGIGTVLPSRELDVEGNIQVGTGTDGCVEDADGTAIAGSCSSDIRLKENITLMPNLLNNLRQISSVTYTWKAGLGKGTEEQIGLIAQDVERSLPQLVTVGADGYKKIKFQYLPFVLLQGVNELAQKVEELEQSGSNNNSTNNSPIPVGPTLDQSLIALISDWKPVVDERLASESASLASAQDRISNLETTVDQLNALLSGFNASSSGSYLDLSNYFATDSASAVLTRDIAFLGRVSTGPLSVAGNALIDGSIQISSGGINDLTGKLNFMSGKVSVDDKGSVLAESIRAATISGSFKTLTDSAGNAILPANLLSIDIQTPSAATDSMVLVSPTASLSGSLYVGDKQEGSFSVYVTTRQVNPISFDWWVVGKE